jgi:hypothetical protein
MMSIASDTDGDESEFNDDGEDIEDIIAEIEDECSLVLSSPENAELLNHIFDLARTNFEKDRKGWVDFFDDLKIELISTDDEDNSHEILEHHTRKAKLELS